MAGQVQESLVDRLDRLAAELEQSGHSGSAYLGRDDEQLLEGAETCRQAAELIRLALLDSADEIERGD